MGRAREIADLIGGTTPDIILKTSDGAILNLQTSDTTVTADSVLGAINFQAPDEASGTDSILTASKIEAVAEGTFAADNNATKLVFSTGASEAAASKMTLSSGGVLDVDGGITVDNITIDGTEIDLSSGDLTIDVAGDITLDANGQQIFFAKGGTTFGQTSTEATPANFTFECPISDGDIIFKGNDGGSGIEIARFDVSEGGDLLINKTSSDAGTAGHELLDYGRAVHTANATTVQVVNRLSSDGDIAIFQKDGSTVGAIASSSGDLLIDAPADIILDADGAEVKIADGGTNIGNLFNSSNDFTIKSLVNDADLVFKGEDGGSTVTAAFFDMSDAGTFRTGSIGSANPGAGSEGTIIVNGQGGILITGGSSGNTTALRIYSTNSAVTTAAISALGALSKTSGSFKIKHPLPSKTQTHHLVHSFVEAPEAANIYRGKVALSSGTATVNLDTSSGMSEGSFESLNRDVQCFTSNETGWTAVKGAVSFLSYDFQLEDGSGSLIDESGNTLITEGVHSNILTITAQDNSCTDTISWLVIGQRHDSHMYETDWTDSNGRVIVEPLQIPKEEYDYRLGK